MTKQEELNTAQELRERIRATERICLHVEPYKWMGKYGKEIIAKGYAPVVKISNYIDETKPERPLVNIAKDFINELDYKLQDPELRHWECEWTWREHECIYCVQDTELQGLGIYVFFKSTKAAEECEGKYGR